MSYKFIRHLPYFRTRCNGVNCYCTLNHFTAFYYCKHECCMYNVYCRLLCGRVSYTIVNCILGSSLPHVFCVTPDFLCLCSIIMFPVRVCSRRPVPVSLYTFNTSFFPFRRLLTLTFPFLSTCHWIGRP